MVPCPWCGSTFPLVHEGDCFLIVAEERAMEQGRKEGRAKATEDAARFLETHRVLPLQFDPYSKRPEVIFGHTPENDAMAAAIRLLNA